MFKAVNMVCLVCVTGALTENCWPRRGGSGSSVILGSQLYSLRGITNKNTSNVLYKSIYSEMSLK